MSTPEVWVPQMAFRLRHLTPNNLGERHLMTSDGETVRPVVLEQRHDSTHGRIEWRPVPWVAEHE